MQRIVWLFVAHVDAIFLSNSGLIGSVVGGRCDLNAVYDWVSELKSMFQGIASLSVIKATVRIAIALAHNAAS